MEGDDGTSGLCGDTNIPDEVAGERFLEGTVLLLLRVPPLLFGAIGLDIDFLDETDKKVV